MKHLGLLTRLIAGIIIGTVIGLLGGWLGVADSVGFTSVVRLFATFNSLFSTFLSFLIPLIILSFVTVGLAELGKKANRLFGVTLLLAYGTTVCSGFLTFLLGKALLPSLIQPISGDIAEAASAQPFFSIDIPPVFGVMTALILAFVLGIGMANSKGTSLLSVCRDLQGVISLVLGKIVIPLIPVHIAGLFCNIAAEGRLFGTVKMFASLYIIIIALQLLYIVSQFGLASLICKKNHFKSIRNIVPAYFTALGTQSSASTIPVALECAYSNEVDEDVADFCIPLCATINLNGDTITLVLGAMGIMLASGLTPTIAMFAPFIMMLGITMVAAPGVPGGGVMAALGLISSMLGFTNPMQQLIIALHFSQDSFGTATNVSGDQAIALIVNKLDQKPAVTKKAR
ncbi:dicarboxylate/amino acid:cation symporter [Intestinibacillus massiliensis]|uniref:dicarboxylate/amino acid:cation symporter n=1 Tax=Intestinibacillus massiliensis TaxID=1871029 RepID=UPI000B34EF3B|nr:dicarboxylate/amino acid:cation symporter [Intestinibacillus massiliensis]MCB6366954.1 dicarboxylate/amino acid:cation symporter [Intestinibacillus massiliensis]